MSGSRIGPGLKIFSIPELDSDPSDPNDGDAWVRRTGESEDEGKPIGLLLALTNSGATYEFSYKTINDGIKRRDLT